MHPVGDSVDHFIGTFSGPQGTSYQGGRFDVDIVAPDRYPFEPLKIKFITKVPWSCPPSSVASSLLTRARDDPVPPTAGLPPKCASSAPRFPPRPSLTHSPPLPCPPPNRHLVRIGLHLPRHPRQSLVPVRSSLLPPLTRTDPRATHADSVYTLRTCLVSLQSLLSSPEPTDPQDAEVVRLPNPVLSCPLSARAAHPRARL